MMRLDVRLRPWALLAFAALALSCSDAVNPCATDDDCREGFRCDTTLYAGECVQSVYVIRCGDRLCAYGREMCIGGECLPLSDMGLARDMSVPFDSGPDLDMSLEPDNGGFGGAGGQGGFGGEPDPPDMGPEPPSVVITAPFDGSILFDGSVDVIGQVFRLADGGSARLLVDDEEPGIPLILVDGRRFETTVQLDPGVHTLTVVAVQDGLEDRETVTVRIDAFVEMIEGQFVQAGSPFRFAGVAMPDLLDVAVSDPDAVGPLLAQAAEMGATVVRTRAYDDRPFAPTVIQQEPGVLTEAGLDALDLIVEQAGIAGIKLLLSLGDGGTTYGGPPQYLNWAALPGANPADWQAFFGVGLPREQFKAYVRTIVSRLNRRSDLPYRDDPSIMGWLILDDVDAIGVYDDGTGEGVSQFYADVLPVIVANAPRQLIATGDTGYDINPQPYGMAGVTLQDIGAGALLDGTHQLGWQRYLRLPAIDFATITVDPIALGFAGDANALSNAGAAWIRGHGVVAAGEGRPLVITARLPAALPVPDRRQIAQAWFDEVASFELAGFMLGDFEAPGQMSGRDTAWSWDPALGIDDPANVFADLIRAFDAVLNP